MQDSVSLVEDDLELLNALQIAPRASWADLSGVLERDATALARRWHRLTTDGIARITAFPRQSRLAEQHVSRIELTCRNGEVLNSAQAIAADPRTLTVEITSGTHQLALTVLGAPDLADYTLGYLSTFPDVLSYRLYAMTSIPYEAHRWHVRALSPKRRNQLTALAGPAGSGAEVARPLTELDRAVIARLRANGRATYAELARDLDISPSTAARQVNRLLRAEAVGLRCDIARQYVGWPYSAVLWGIADVDAIADSWTAAGDCVPELRFGATVAGPDNILLVLWLHAVTDLPRVEQVLTAQLPGLRITDRSLRLRMIKYMGHRLDDSERFAEPTPVFQE
ncbi:Lrp/AsnC family transcriptional regulator [Prauserella halophila]|uniref:Lrp/AsnC family transcriptional regulator n=1 Tax=Prauserella halophila TaxID=185641 RepID=A0ABN1W371_9PSEU|nr:Lrp/AsnC family transcriptional regulator [Prauserella halophila]MCP2236230.1 DNA-binding transcriptional regulator, Lrp family [Prauserella halophila]